MSLDNICNHTVAKSTYDSGESRSMSSAHLLISLTKDVFCVVKVPRR